MCHLVYVSLSKIMCMFLNRTMVSAIGEALTVFARIIPAEAAIHRDAPQQQMLGNTLVSQNDLSAHVACIDD